MVASLAAVGLALRAGLTLRRARRTGLRRTPDMRRRHVRIARPALVAVAVGFAAGPLSMLWLRDRAPFETAHGWLGAAALALFAATGVLGRRLERGRSRALDAHALCGVLAALLAGAAAVAGFVLLP
jgi:hypothetical protein